VKRPINGNGISHICAPDLDRIPRGQQGRASKKLMGRGMIQDMGEMAQPKGFKLH